MAERGKPTPDQRCWDCPHTYNDHEWPGTEGERGAPLGVAICLMDGCPCMSFNEGPEPAESAPGAREETT